MKIIRKQPNSSGAYPPINAWGGTTPPGGYAIIPDDVDTSVFYTYNGFVTLTVEDNTVTGFIPDVEAWEAWKANLPEPTPPKPTVDERIAELETINAELEDAMCEMDSANQEEITALNETVSALEDALCEMDAANEERMAAIEDALCEMDMG